MIGRVDVFCCDDGGGCGDGGGCLGGGDACRLAAPPARKYSLAIRNTTIAITITILLLLYGCRCY